MVSLFGSASKDKEKDKKPGFLDRLKQAVASTKAQLVERIEEIVDKKPTLDASVLDALESTLITADLGVRTTQENLGRLKQQISQGKLRETAQLRPAVEQAILDILQNPAQGSAAPKATQPPPGMPTVIFVVGVNGVGKTTSIAKLAHFFKQQDRKTLLCAADTFRAAANEQLEIWAGRLGIDMIKQKSGADPAAVEETMSGLFSSANSRTPTSTQTATPLGNRYQGNANSQSTTTTSLLARLFNTTKQSRSLAITLRRLFAQPSWCDLGQLAVVTRTSNGDRIGPGRVGRAWIRNPRRRLSRRGCLLLVPRSKSMGRVR